MSFLNKRLNILFYVTVPPFLMNGAPSGTELLITATPPPAHHFNIKAPAKPKPLKYDGTKAEYKFEQSAMQKGQEFNLYLCDDANTYCIKKTAAVKWAEGKLVPAEAPVRSETETKKPEKSGDDHGFIMNDAAKALALAKKTGKPLLIDFYGIWCPPCNQLNEEVFPTMKFKKASKDFVLLKLDADAESSWSLKSKYVVGGYPTVIFANSDGEEISRLVGYYPTDKFTAAMKDAHSSRNEPYSTLIRKGEGGDLKAAHRAGKIALERKEWQTAVRLLEKTNSPEYMTARIHLLEELQKDDPGLKNELIEVLKKTAGQFPGTIQELDAIEKLASLSDESGKKALQERYISTARMLIGKFKSGTLNDTDVSDVDLHAMIAGMQEELGLKEDARKSYLAAVDAYKKRDKGAIKNRSSSLEAAWCLWKSGNFQESENIYSSFEKKYPSEFTFYFAHARMLEEQKKYADSITKARKALELSYGDNRLRVTELLARNLDKSGDKEGALDLLKKTIRETNLPEDKSIRTHRYVANLEKLQKKILESKAN